MDSTTIFSVNEEVKANNIKWIFAGNHETKFKQAPQPFKLIFSVQDLIKTRKSVLLNAQLGKNTHLGKN